MKYSEMNPDERIKHLERIVELTRELHTVLSIVPSDVIEPYIYDQFKYHVIDRTGFEASMIESQIQEHLAETE